MKKPKIDKLKPMKMSTMLNCVAERIMEHFKNAMRGNGLTDSRHSKITAWTNRVKDNGATIKDVADLESALQFPVTVASLTGEVLYPLKYNRRGAPITIIDHNSHAWTDSVRIFLRDRVVKYYSGNMFECIYQMSKIDPVSVWLFRSSEECNYVQFVKPNGEIYRTEKLQ